MDLVDRETSVGDGKAPSNALRPEPWNALKIPAKINGYDVLAVTGMAFYRYSRLTSVELPPKTVYIGGCAFAECTALRTLILPPGLKQVGSGAFGNVRVTRLTAARLPGGGLIPENIEEVTVPEGVTELKRLLSPAAVT